MKKTALAVIIVLLTSIVGYLALDRHDKNVAEKKNQAFDQKFAK